MNKDIENIIRANLPEKKDYIYEEGNSKHEQFEESMDYETMGEAHEVGFNQALSQINPSLIADEVLNVVVEKIEKLPVEVIGVKVDFRNPKLNSNGIICIRKDTILQLLSNLSPNKENKNYE